MVILKLGWLVGWLIGWLVGWLVRSLLSYAGGGFHKDGASAPSYNPLGSVEA